MKKIVSLCLMLAMSMMIWADRTFYFLPNSNWTQADAKFVVYYYDNGTNTNGWSDIMTAVAGETDVYTTTVPDTFPNLIFVRLNSTATAGNWTDKWDQTVDLTMPDSAFNCFTLNDGWSQIGGTWSTYGASIEPQPQDTTGTPDPATPRFYLTGDDAFVGAGKTSWNKDDAYVSYGDTLTLNLAAGTYEMKLITPDDQWIGYSALTEPVTAGITTNSWGNIIFTLNVAGDVTFIYNANLFKIEGTFAVPEYHFYYVGTNNGWDPGTAIEFTNADTAYTLAMDSLYGEFKIMTVRGDWSSLSYGANDQSAQVSAGVPYVMAEWAANNMVVNGVFANVTLAMTLVEGVATITIIAEEDTTSGVEPQPIEVNYYIKNNWDGAVDWTWQPMAWTADSLACTYTGVFGGTGVNINTEQSDNGSMWFTVADMAIGIGGRVPQAGDTVLFTFTIGMHTLAAEVLGRSGVEPQPAENYYIKNNWNGAADWTWQLMEALPGEIWQYVDVYGGTGVNVNTVAEDNGAIWFAESDWDIANNFVPQAGDTLMFWFIPADTLLRVHLIGRPGTIEPVEMVEVRLVPGVWDKDGAKFAAVVWNEGETMEENGVFTDWMVGTDTVSTMIPADADSIAFGRLNPEAEEPAMEYVWNHTDKLAIDPSLIYTITGWGEAGADCSTGYWGEPEPIEPEGLEEIAIEGKEALKALVKKSKNSFYY